MDFEPALGRFMSPVLNDIEVAIVDVEVPAVQVEDSASVHDLAPLEGSEHPPGPTQPFERARSIPPVIDSEVPVAIWSVVPADS